ncbi:MAG: UvrB/UvrC motif-containing protein, partial [Candidatus Nanopelagicales bacterium]|nr:UvrB/UvrC motif-containing protein [Candidatus Nanopelagicales bacterium]
RMRQLAKREEFEEAAAWRERLRALLTGIDRQQRESMITACPEVVAARLDGSEWEVHVIRFGRLAGASRVQAGADPRAVVEATVATAQYVAPPGSGSAPHLPEESALVLRWLSSDGVRLVRLDGVLALPVGGAGRDLAELGRPQPIEYPDSEPPRGATSPVPQALVSRLRPV